MDVWTWSSMLIALLFCIGYFCIIYEHQTGIHKAASSLGMAALCWLIACIDPHYHAEDLFASSLGHASEICFFLFGALAIVQVMDAHHSFSLITRYITARSPKALLWIIGACSFFLSAILDNLTTTVIMITLLQQIVNKGETRWLLGGAIVIAANAGGAWTPIGDVTTTMLWIGGQISAISVIQSLLVPSLVCSISALMILSSQLKSISDAKTALEPSHFHNPTGTRYSALFLVLGIGLLLCIPIVKTLTGLPPVMCMLLGLSFLWILADFIHPEESKDTLRIPVLLRRVDIPSILFFLGILLAVEALEMSGLLVYLAEGMGDLFPNQQVIAFTMGLISAVIDNVPLVAATMKMYTLEAIPTASLFWHAIAYTAGTGGSILIIGSAAGVALMGIEGVTFGWWLRRIAPAAFVGYAAGFFLHFFLALWV